MLSGDEPGGGTPIALAVLAVGVVLEGSSLLRATRQTSIQARMRRRSFGRYLRESRDPTTKTVVFEDSAAVVGLFLAAIGLVLTQVTGSVVFDGAASVAIGIVLAVVAFLLGRDTKALLIGESATAEERARLREVFEAHTAVDELIELLTMVLGPESLLVAARFDPADALDSRGIEALADELEQQLRDAVPDVDAGVPRSDAA